MKIKKQNYKNHFSEQVMHLCAKFGWTRNRLAKEANLTDTTIYALYRRDDKYTPTPLTIKKLAKAFGLPASFLIETIA